jgi:hypothetical protein
VDVYHTIDLLAGPGNSPPPTSGKPVNFSLKVLQRTGPGTGPSAFSVLKDVQGQTISQFQTQKIFVPVTAAPVSATRSKRR